MSKLTKNTFIEQINRSITYSKKMLAEAKAKARRQLFSQKLEKELDRSFVRHSQSGKRKFQRAHMQKKHIRKDN